MSNLFISVRNIMLNYENISYLVNTLITVLDIDEMFLNDIILFNKLLNIEKTEKELKNIESSFGNEFITIKKQDYVVLNNLIFVGGHLLTEYLKDMINRISPSYSISDFFGFTRSPGSSFVSYISQLSQICNAIAFNSVAKAKDFNIKNIFRVILGVTDILIKTSFSDINKNNITVPVLKSCLAIFGIAFTAFIMISGASIGIGFIGVLLIVFCISELIAFTNIVLTKLIEAQEVFKTMMAETSQFTFCLAMYNQLKTNIGILYFNLIYKNISQNLGSDTTDQKLYEYKNNTLLVFLMEIVNNIMKLHVASLPSSSSVIFIGDFKSTNLFSIFTSNAFVISQFVLNSKQLRKMIDAVILNNLQFKATSQESILKNIETNVIGMYTDLESSMNKLYYQLSETINALIHVYDNDENGVPDVQTLTEIANALEEYTKTEFDKKDSNIVIGKYNTLSAVYNDIINFCNAKTITDDYNISNLINDITNAYNNLLPIIEGYEQLAGVVKNENSENNIIPMTVEQSIASIRDSLFSNAGVFGNSTYANMLQLNSQAVFANLDIFGYNPFNDNVYYKIYLVKESDIEYLLYDSLYTYNSLISVDITKSDKTPIRTLKLVLNNPFKTLNNINYVKLSKDFSASDINDDIYLSIFLRPGTKIKVMVSRDILMPEYTTEFVGDIAEIQGDNPLTIIASNPGGGMLASKYHMDNVYKYSLYADSFSRVSPIHAVVSQILYDIDKYGNISDYTYIDIGGVYIDTTAMNLFKAGRANKLSIVERLVDSIKKLILRMSPSLNSLDKKYDIISRKTNVL